MGGGIHKNNKGENMNKAELVEKVSDNTGYAKSQVTEILNEVIEVIAKTVKKDKVQLVGLGTFQGVRRKARVGVNPSTGKKIKIPARKALKFTPTAALKKL